MKSLAYYNEQNESILHPSDSEHYKTLQMSGLMSEMEKQYQIFMLRKLDWEKENRTVIALYRKISRSRSFD